MKKILSLIALSALGGFATVEELKGNAGCLIQEKNKILLVTQNSGKLSLPGGTSNSNETAQQTAIRETYEETQLLVSPVKLIKIFKNNFYLFECHIKKHPKILQPLKSFNHEITRVGFYDINSLNPSDLRYPSQYRLYLCYQESN